jgi:hypothetical protein
MFWQSAGLLYPVVFLVYPQDILRCSAFRPGLGPASSAFPIFEGGRLWQWLSSNVPVLLLCLTILLESDSYLVVYCIYKVSLACLLKSLLKVSDLLVKVKV